MPTVADELQPTALILRAAAFAAAKHRDQRRKGVEATPYVNHCISVAAILSEEGGVSDPVVLAAALLHDTMEDTQTTRRELDESFGAEVAAIVAEVTDDKTLAKATRKERQVQHAAHLSDGAKLVKLADKISNVRDVASSPPADWPLERRREYFEWAKRVVDGLGAVNGPLQAAFARQYQQRP